MDTTSNIYAHANEIIYEFPEETARGLNSKDGAFIFAAYGCALAERQTDSGVYVYTAANMATGKTLILSRRSQRLTSSGFLAMAAKIKDSAISGDSRFSAEKKPSETTRGSVLKKVASHIFSKILPRHGYNIREKQMALSEHMLGVIESRGVTLAESEVGTGKTHAYLIAALLAKRGRLNDFWLRGHYKDQSWAASAYMPVVISTSSIALQNAIVKDYVPELSNILIENGVIKKPLVAMVRKGKEHYVCERRLKIFYESTDARTKAKLDPFVGRRAPFDLTDAGSLTAHMKRYICVSGKCGGSCKYKQQCRYTAYIEKANSSAVDFQITNHNYFLADVKHRASSKKPLLPHYQLVIIDEAHKFLAAARSMYGLELSSAELPALAREVHTFTQDKSNSGVNVNRLAKRLTEQSQKLFERLNENVPEAEKNDEADRFPAVIDSDAARHLKNIAGIAVSAAEAAADSHVSSVYADRRDKAVWRLNDTGERVADLRKQGNQIHWLENRVEGETESQALCALPKDLNLRLANDLWSNGVPIILTSGTLSASGDFTRQKETLGLDYLPKRKLFDTTMASPFDYKNNAMLYISENTLFPNNKDKRYITSIADEVERLVLASHGHAAVLFTSYNVMGQVHSILKDRKLPFPLFRMERRGTNAIEQFKKSKNGILLASGALWEGIDIPGDTLSMLIIVKLPFAVPDPVSDYERSLYSSFDEYMARAIIPDMLVKLKQGFGRLIRNETDTGVVAILDCRANTRGAFRNKVLPALPLCRLTSRVRAVRDFYREKKSPAYFAA